MKRALIPVSLAMIFVAPLAAAWGYFHLHHGLLPGGLQHGELLQPLQPLRAPPLTAADGKSLDITLFRGRWTLLYHTAHRCGAECQRLLATLHNVRLAQGQTMAQLQRVLVLAMPPAAEEMQALHASDLQVVTTERWPLPAEWVYLLDPHGNLVMRYPPGFAARGLLQDLQRLLKQTEVQ